METVESSRKEWELVVRVFSFIGEESVAAGEKSVLTDNPTWIIDPIDGTTNFVHRYVANSLMFSFLLVY